MSDQYVAVINAFKVTTTPADNINRSTREPQPKPTKTKSEDVKLTVRAESLDALKIKVAKVLDIIDEEEFKA